MWESKLLGCFMHCKKTKNCNISDYYECVDFECMQINNIFPT